MKRSGKGRMTILIKTFFFLFAHLSDPEYNEIIVNGYAFTTKKLLFLFTFSADWAKSEWTVELDYRAALIEKGWGGRGEELKRRWIGKGKRGRIKGRMRRWFTNNQTNWRWGSKRGVRMEHARDTMITKTQMEQKWRKWSEEEAFKSKNDEYKDGKGKLQD